VTPTQTSAPGTFTYGRHPRSCLGVGYLRAKSQNYFTLNNIVMALRRIGVSNFKGLVGATAFKVVKNPKSGKIFVSGDNGHNYKCQGDLDPSKDVEFLVDTDDMDSACLINTDRGQTAAPIMTL
jgi:hypothetical protein